MVVAHFYAAGGVVIARGKKLPFNAAVVARKASDAAGGAGGAACVVVHIVKAFIPRLRPFGRPAKGDGVFGVAPFQIGEQIILLGNQRFARGFKCAVTALSCAGGVANFAC